MRNAYVALAGLLLLTVVFQFLTAGMIVFDGEANGAHTGAGAGAAHLWPLLMVIVAAVGKLGRAAIVSGVVLVVLVGVQSLLPESGAALLHPLVALIIAFGAYHALMGARAGAAAAPAS